MEIKDRLLEKLTYYMICFLFISVVGWLWEGAYVGIRYGAFLNRGFLHGPWLPIYGLGGTIIIAVLSDYREKPLQVFIMAGLISGVLEFVTSVLQEEIYHTRWWDYSCRFLNIQGRVCGSNLILFGFAGMVAIYTVDPFLRKHYQKHKGNLLSGALFTLSIIFLLDLLISLVIPNTGIGITS